MYPCLNQPASTNDDMDVKEEKMWVDRLRKGDADAQYLLYHRYAERLAAVCMRYVADHEDVKDILQESFLKIFTSVPSFQYRGQGALEAWMTRIVVNESLRFLRKKGRLNEVLVFQDDLKDTEWDDEAFSGLEKIPQQELLKMVARLPDGYRTVLNLYVFEQKSHKEIAKLLNIGEKTSSSQLSKAKHLLGKWIVEYKKQHAYE